MLRPDDDACVRISMLESRLRRTQIALIVCILGGAGAFMFGWGDEKPPAAVSDELRTRRLVVVDDKEVPRLIIGQDPKDTQRRSRAAGITIFDSHGNERGGFSTFEDDSVVLSMDAPAGVGDKMRDRLGLTVEASGAASIGLIDNLTKIPVRLVCEPDGSGGIEFIDYDMVRGIVAVKRLGFQGETVQELPLGGR